MLHSIAGPSLRTIGAGRLGLGLLQGIALYLLSVAAQNAVWPATEGLFFVPFFLVAWFAPPLASTALGNLPRRSLVVWIALASALLVGLGLHDVLRGGENQRPWFLGANWMSQGRAVTPSPILIIFSAVGLFIAQSLIVAAAGSHKIIVDYFRYFDTAWKYAIQVILSIAFVAAFWILLSLGSGLFQLIKISFFSELIRSRWFSIPATTLALAAAIHVTDVRVGMVEGVRTLKLTLLSWLLPLMALIVGGFLASPFFTGLEPLWKTRHATALMLSAAAALVVLINAAYQEGGADRAVPALMRHAGTLSAVALLPLVAITGYGLALRVGQYGWTTERIIAGAFVVVVACYAGGYAWAAVPRRGPWLKRLEICNILTAFVILAVLLALFTPIADPARISVASQVALLDSGKISPDRFDFAYLHFQGARYGKAALEKLESRQGADQSYVREHAEAALRMTNRFAQVAVGPKPQELADNIAVYPAGHGLPDTFVNFDWSSLNAPVLPFCLKDRTKKCEAYLVFADNGGLDEIILSNADGIMNAVVFKADGDRGWSPVGTFDWWVSRCKDVRELLRAGQVKSMPPAVNDLDVGGRRVRLQTGLISGQDKCS